jgi:prophage maintenance system killer protein
LSSKNEIVIFTDENLELEVPITPERDTVWLTQEQMSVLFDTARSSIAYHIGNIFREKEVDKRTSVEIFDRSENRASRPPTYYNLDVIISVGYRVKSKRGVAFRKWANDVLKHYILQGYAVNQNRIKDLGEVIRIMKRTENNLDVKQVLSVIEHYNRALDLLDDYDHQIMKRPKGNKSTYVLTYQECMQVIGTMKFGNDSFLFGKEKDDSFEGSIGNIYQSFGGNDLYSSLEEKAANLLYFVTKNHSFVDGNKRIAATMFLYFLDKNGVLFADNRKLIDDHTLVALTIMIAVSKPDEKEMMISIVMNCI